MPGPLLFKGRPRFASASSLDRRFSQDIDLDATHKNGFEETAAFQPPSPTTGSSSPFPFAATTTSAARSSTHATRSALREPVDQRAAISLRRSRSRPARSAPRPIARGGAVGGIVEVRLCQQLDQLILHVRAQLATSGAGVAARISAPESSAMVLDRIASSYQGYSTRVATSQITSNVVGGACRRCTGLGQPKVNRGATDEYDFVENRAKDRGRGLQLERAHLFFPQPAHGAPAREGPRPPCEFGDRPP